MDSSKGSNVRTHAAAHQLTLGLQPSRGTGQAVQWLGSPITVQQQGCNQTEYNNKDCVLTAVAMQAINCLVTNFRQGASRSKQWLAPTSL